MSANSPAARARASSVPELSIPVDVDNIRAVVAEFVGTTLFLWSGTMAITASGGDNFLIASSLGLTLVICIAMVGPISGGHINPAVTLAMIITRNMNPLLGAFYMLAQFAGATFGTLVSYGIATSFLKGGVEVSVRINAGAALLAEALGTFLLVMTVFATAVQTNIGIQTNEKVAVRSQAPLLIGISVWAAHLALIAYTGCSINPARWFGTALVLGVWKGNAWVYIFGPALGAVAAALVQYGLYGTVRPQSPENSVSSPKPHSP